MSTRMDKYYKEETLEDSRTNRNRSIYKKVEQTDYEKLNLNNNISVIDADADNLNINELRKILDDKYAKKRRQIEEEQVEPEQNLENTKEYDLKKMIDEAHKNKNEDYDKERFKKLRETQYDILNSLDLNRIQKPAQEEQLTDEENELMTLIKTIDENSLKRDQIKKKETELLDDLKGNDDTEVLEPVSFDDDDTLKNGKKPTLVEELEKTKQLSKKEIADAYKKERGISIEDTFEATSESEYIKDKMDDTMEDSFYTGKLQIKQNDMDTDTFDDIESELGMSSIAIKILILVLVIIVVVIAVFLLNKYLDLGLF